MTAPLIQLFNLSKSFEGDAALHPLNLEIQDGEFLTLLGPSGCGKTTLLRLLAGFEKPDTGQIHLNGQRIDPLPPEKRHINMVFQSYALFPHMTVFNNVAFGLKCQGMAQSDRRSRVIEALKRVKLEDFAQRYPGQLSGGQQQRVAMARAVVNEPTVLLLDEPLSALDYHLRRNMQFELKALQRRLGITFVMVTHDQEEALSLSDRIVVMNHGCIEQIGSPRDVYEEPQNLYVAGFVGVANIFNKTVLSATQNTIEVEVAGTRVHFKNPDHFKSGDFVNIVIRPEDIKVWNVREVSSESEHEYLPGTVDEVVYKGSTVDLLVILGDGERISATEFFDEDDDQLEYEIGEKVLIEWQPGWEVVLRGVEHV
jgi:spermidine/putrescine transport system ATP-binding protein